MAYISITLLPTSNQAWIIVEIDVDGQTGGLFRGAGGQMRIIAGRWRSRRVLRPTSSVTRPVPDRIREAIFDMLGSHYDTPGLLPALHVADVFAGSGSMGLEALSRGAASCCFFERDRGALATLRKNLDALQVGPEGSIVSGNAWTQAVASPDGHPFELVFLDPPYVDSEDASGSGAVAQYLKRLYRIEGDKPLVVLHHRSSVRYAPEPGDEWSILNQRAFGSGSVTFFQS